MIIIFITTLKYTQLPTGTYLPAITLTTVMHFGHVLQVLVYYTFILYNIK